MGCYGIRSGETEDNFIGDIVCGIEQEKTKVMLLVDQIGSQNITRFLESKKNWETKLFCRQIF